VTSVTDAESRLLDQVPIEISEVLDCYRMGNREPPASPVLLEFAGKFLGAIYEDGLSFPGPCVLLSPKYLRC
jgi:hypothetical protein